jgi:hypothetical protein
MRQNIFERRAQSRWGGGEQFGWFLCNFFCCNVKSIAMLLLLLLATTFLINFNHFVNFVSLWRKFCKTFIALRSFKLRALHKKDRFRFTTNTQSKQKLEEAKSKRKSLIMSLGIKRKFLRLWSRQRVIKRSVPVSPILADR